uniref:Uncharacterized protein n=1 Tax=Peronospora matthiolae TaxID=2874970 RepID=A0AAV1V2I0_9STRA
MFIRATTIVAIAVVVVTSTRGTESWQCDCLDGKHDAYTDFCQKNYDTKELVGVHVSQQFTPRDIIPRNADVCTSAGFSATLD